MYIVYETCCQHQYALASLTYGSRLEVPTIGICAEVATSHVSHHQFRVASEKQDVDADPERQFFVQSMLSPVVFERRLLFVDEAIAVFDSSNRLSNVLCRSARRPWAEDGDPESADGEVPTHLPGRQCR